MKMFGCEWSTECYATTNPELLNRNRVRYTCIESGNDFYPVGAIIDCADSENFEKNPCYCVGVDYASYICG